MVQNVSDNNFKFISSIQRDANSKLSQDALFGFPLAYFHQKTRSTPAGSCEVIVISYYIYIYIYTRYPLSGTRYIIILIFYTIPMYTYIETVYIMRLVHAAHSFFIWTTCTCPIVFLLGLFDLCAHTDCQPHGGSSTPPHAVRATPPPPPPTINLDRNTLTLPCDVVAVVWYIHITRLEDSTAVGTYGRRKTRV